MRHTPGPQSNLSVPSKDSRSPMPTSLPSNALKESEYEFILSGPRNFSHSVVTEVPLLKHVLGPDVFSTFEGREEALKMINTAISPCVPGDTYEENQGLRVFTICGPGGMGKTQLATKFISDKKLQFDIIS
jgi:hypothetical protein